MHRGKMAQVRTRGEAWGHPQTRGWFGTRTFAAQEAVLVLIAITFIMRVLFGLELGLGVDESYTAATSRELQLSTFDHPPAAWWIAWAARRLLATEHPLAMRLPFIMLFALTTWLMFRLTSAVFWEEAGFWAAATLNLAPVIGWTSGTWVLPDAPLNASLVAGAYAVARATLGAAPRAWLWWLLAGACGGAALLSKFHGVFLFAGTALFLLSSREHRCWLLTPWPYLGAMLAAAIFMPVIVWNAQHDWVSFEFQASRARPLALDPWGPFRALAAQALYVLPWLWLPMVWCLGEAVARGPADPRRWMMACLGMGPLILFAVLPLAGVKVLPHWAAPGYLLIVPLLGARIATAMQSRHGRLMRAWIAGTALSLALVLAAIGAMASLPWPTVRMPGGRAIPYPLIGALDWKELEVELEKRGLMRHGVFIAATRWHEAGKIDYALGGRLSVLCLCVDPRGYGVLTRPRSHLGETGLIIGRALSPDGVQSVYGDYFQSIEQTSPVVITRAGRKALDLSVYIAHGLREPAFAPNLLDPPHRQ